MCDKSNDFISECRFDTAPHTVLSSRTEHSQHSNICSICPQDDGILTYDLEPGLQPTDGTADVEAAAPSGVGNHRRQPLAGEPAQREVLHGGRTLALRMGGRADHADQHASSGKRLHHAARRPAGHRYGSQRLRDGSPRRRRRLCRATVSSSTASRTCG